MIAASKGMISQGGLLARLSTIYRSYRQYESSTKLPAKSVNYPFNLNVRKRIVRNVLIFLAITLLLLVLFVGLMTHVVAEQSGAPSYSQSARSVSQVAHLGRTANARR